MPSIGTGIKQLVESYRYAYPSARAKARKSLLLTAEQLVKVLETANLKEAVQSLGETEYGPLVSGKKGIIEVESALTAHIAESLVKVSEFLPGTAREIFKRYLELYEAENIKSVLVGINAGVPPHKILQMVVPLYLNLQPQDYEKMASSTTVETAVSVLNHTIFGTALTRGFNDFEHSRSLTQTTAELDFMLYDRIFRLISTSTGSDVESLRAMIGIEVDIKNIKSILRLRSAGTDPEQVLSYLIPHNYRLDSQTLEVLAKSGTPREIISKLEKTYYGKAIRIWTEEIYEGNMVRALENALDDFYVNAGMAFYRGYPLSIGPVLGYVIAKTHEVRGLISILKLKDEGFGRDEITEVLGL